MRELHRNVLVHVSPERAFEIVANVEEYPRFIDSCSRVEVLESGDRDLSIDLTVHKGSFEATYPVHLDLVAPKRIRMHCEAESVMRLEAEWRFSPVADNQCRIDVTARYAFPSVIKTFLLGPVVEHICTDLIDVVAAEAAAV